MSVNLHGCESPFHTHTKKNIMILSGSHLLLSPQKKCFPKVLNIHLDSKCSFYLKVCQSLSMVKIFLIEFFKISVTINFSCHHIVP